MTRTTIDPAADCDGDRPGRRDDESTLAGDLLRTDTHVSQDGTVTMVMAGEIDLVTVPLLRRRVTDLLAQAHRRLVLDMRQVGFLGSSGLAELVEIHTEAARRGVELRLVSDSRAVLRPLIATGLVDLFDIAAQPEGE